MKKKSLRLSIIGAGRVGQTLGRLGQEAGYDIADVVCPTRRVALTAGLFIRARRPQAKSGARAFEIPTAMKPLYHAAAVMACGGVTALLSASLDALQHCGLKEAEARRVLLPLSEATLANVHAVGPHRALTGPVRRADVGTVQQNLDALGAIDAQWRTIYRLLAAQSLRLVEPQMDRAIVDALRNLLTTDC